MQDMPTKEPVAKRMEESSDSSDSEADSEDEVIIYYLFKIEASSFLVFIMFLHFRSTCRIPRLLLLKRTKNLAIAQTLTQILMK
jgi:hypothetical protein